MLTNYFWDVALAEALVPFLHGVELALRNSIHTHLSAFYGTPLWFYQPGALEPGQLSQLSAALSQLAARRTEPTPGHIVAELTFGFWVTLVSDPYQKRLWQHDGYALLRHVFPNASGLSRKEIHARYNRIRRELRNRVFHYEAIWDRPNLLREHADIQEAIAWISPDLARALRGIDRFSTVFADRAGIELRLRQSLNL